MLSLLLVSLLADVEPFISGPMPVHSELAAAKPKQVTAFFAQLTWNRNGSELYQLSGKTFSIDDRSGMGGNCSYDDGRLVQKGTRLIGTALQVCLSGDGNELSRGRNTVFDIDVMAVSRDLAIFVERGERYALECTKAGCDQTPATVIELIPGADGPLFDKVKASLGALRTSSAGLSLSSSAVLHERGRATNPRETTELFFAAGRENEAKAIARFLEPLLGSVVPRAWPGKTLSDVVIVTGKR